MKKKCKKLLIALLLLQGFFFYGLTGVAQEWVKPIRNTTLLSGNFGELRATHFHSGIDIRTGGVEGLPVICVQDGILARASISPTGYGLALYIEHPNGMTTVYGHLQRFVPKITQIMKEIQYRQESFKVDESLKSYKLHFWRGDTIAYSGNSGSSGGPHLHFEIRNTHTEHAINPLTYYRVEDNRAPQVQRITFYKIEDNGQIKPLSNHPVKAIGNEPYNAGRLTMPEGRIGIGLFVIDRMTGSTNKLGVYHLSLLANKDTLFNLKMDSCSFAQKPFINEIKDFDAYKKHETIYRCFGHQQHNMMGLSNKNKGAIELKKDSTVQVKISLSDINGNCSVVNLTLKGGINTPSVMQPEILAYTQAHTLELPGAKLILEKEALYFSVEKKLKTKKDTLSGQNIFVFSDKEIPLFRKGRLLLEGAYNIDALICEVGQGGRKYPLPTKRNANGLEAEVGFLSTYTVAYDQEKPSINYLGQFPGRMIRFRIKDEFSGIASFRGEVNGKWCLFLYEPRTAIMEASLLEPVFLRGEDNQVKIIVEDMAGNCHEIMVIVKC